MPLRDPVPISSPMATGRAVCDNTRRVTLRDVAPSAMRTPISFVRCSTRYDSTLKSPDTVSVKASVPSTSVTQKAICQEIGLHSRHGPHRQHLTHVRIDDRQPVEEAVAAPVPDHP